MFAMSHRRTHGLYICQLPISNFKGEHICAYGWIYLCDEQFGMNDRPERAVTVLQGGVIAWALERVSETGWRHEQSPFVLLLCGEWTFSNMDANTNPHPSHLPHNLLF